MSTIQIDYVMLNLDIPSEIIGAHTQAEFLKKSFYFSDTDIERFTIDPISTIIIAGGKEFQFVTLHIQKILYTGDNPLIKKLKESVESFDISNYLIDINSKFAKKLKERDRICEKLQRSNDQHYG